MRVGSLVFATDQGLGILAKSFYDHGVLTDVLVIRHGRRPEHDEWYPGSVRIGNLKDSVDLGRMMKFCESVDVVLFFETPFVWSLIDYCRAKGVKTVLMPMHECMPAMLPAWPDLFLCSSELDLQVYPTGVFIPVPVEVPWRQRTKAEVFVHNAGNGGLRGRNGTQELLEAWRFVKSPARLILRYQGACPDAVWYTGPQNVLKQIDHQPGTRSYNELWRNGGEGDVFVFPEKFNGLSLPLQEARASGMLVMCGDRFPMNRWLPTEPLIPITRYDRTRIASHLQEFDEAVIRPQDIAAKIDEWYDKDISEYSLQGKLWAERNSWEALKPRYIQVLEELCSRSCK